MATTGAVVSGVSSIHMSPQNAGAPVRGFGVVKALLEVGAVKMGELAKILVVSSQLPRASSHVRPWDASHTRI
jgi:hypothetical protein